MVFHLQTVWCKRCLLTRISGIDALDLDMPMGGVNSAEGGFKGPLCCTVSTECLSI